MGAETWESDWNGWREKCLSVQLRGLGFERVGLDVWMRMPGVRGDRE
jgi:hypothetical protein